MIRLLQETGRLSANPLYVVGIYSGTEKIGEGYGDSKKMAEYRASRDALMKHYTLESQSIKFPNFDTSTPEEITFFNQDKEQRMEIN